ncbi:MAG: hypothetical protein IBX52_09070 [Bacterioplanes sp.]|nr:hypothetical protein [Bacterioplanes sp.]
MVRLALLVVVVGLSACSSTPTQGPTVSPQASVEREQLTLTAIDEGQHHPAVAVYFRQAEDARLRGRLRQSMTYLDQARQIQPRNPDILYRQAWVSVQMGDAVQAEHLLLRAKVFAQGNGTLLRRLDLLLAESYALQGRAQESALARQRASGLRP